MVALIRNACIGAVRTRLRSPAARATERVETAEVALSAQQTRWREDLESEVRAEMSRQMQALCDVERARARAEGYADGMAQGREDAATEADLSRAEQAVAVERTLTELSAAHASAVERLHASVGEVAFAAICRLVGAELGSRWFERGLVEQACAAQRLEAGVTLRLHPRDVDMLAGFTEDLDRQTGALGVRVVADEALKLGGCVIESASGERDAGLESQLRRLHAILVADAAKPGDAALYEA